MMIVKTAKRIWLTGTITAALLAGVGGAGLHAQGGPGAGQTQPPDFRNLTTEQRQKLTEMTRSYMRKLTIQMMLTNAGFTDPKVQDAVVAFSDEQEKAVQPLRDQQVKLVTAATGENNTDPEVVTMLDDFRKAVAAEKDRQKTALDALDGQINYSKQPRLAAVLTLLSLTGDEMAIADGGTGATMQGGGGGFGGRGGFGGQGGFGGPGGFGGQGGGGRRGRGGRGGRGGNNGGGGGNNGGAPGGGAAAPPAAGAGGNQ